MTFGLFMFAAFNPTYGAEDAASAASAQALLELTVNGVAKDPARVTFVGERLYILVQSLTDAGVTQVPGTPETIDGALYVASDALGPRVKVFYDEENLALSLTVDPTLLAPTMIDLANAPENIEYIRNNTGFLNYALTSQNGKTPSLLSEQGITIGPGFFDNTFSVNTNGRFQRLNTNLTIDSRRRMTRTVLGDTIADAGVLGGASQIAGVTYSKNFSINPYFTPFPGQRFAGVVNTPSSADVYVNGLLVRSIDIPPGPFNLQNLPALAGAGATRVLIRNAFGLTQELGAPYYLDTRVLRRGLHDFSYTAGLQRQFTASRYGEYANPSFVGRHRYGLADTLTAGGFAAGDKDKVAGGPEVTWTLPFGAIGLFGAGSHQDDTPGAAASAQYVYQSLRFSIGSAFTYMSPNYATVGLDRRDDRAVYQYSSFAATRFGAVDLTLNYYQQDFRDAGSNRQVNLTSSLRLFDRFNLAVSLTHNKAANTKASNGIFAALTMPLFGDTAATVSGSHDTSGSTAAVQFQKSRPLGEGFAYLVQASAGSRAVNIADVQYQSRYGLYEIDATHIEGDTNVILTAAGALTYIGGEVYATRPVQDAYGLIRVPDVAGVTGYVSHQDIGKTDARGNLLVPSLLSYYGNQLGIEPLDIPLDYAVEETERTIAPSYRGGAVVTFAVKKLQAFQGKAQLLRAGENVSPAFGELTVTVNGAVISSPIGTDGAFYLENLPPGAWPAEILFEGNACRFSMAVPKTAERFVDMGAVSCTP